MKNNTYHLINAVLRGAWFIEPQSAQSYLPLFLQLIKGEQINKDLMQEAPPLRYSIKSMEDDEWMESEEEPKAEDNVEGVAIMSLIGPVMKYDYCFTPGTKTMAEQIANIDANPKLKGTVLYIDSPGGEALAMELLHNAILNCSKPVIAVVEGMCCSAAMGIASACDEILASGESCIIGSIGTMISFTDVRGWKELEGINFHEIYATKSVDKNKDFRDALNNNYSTIRTQMLDPLNEFFLNMVTNALPGIDEKETLTGKVFLTSKAIEHGLASDRGTIKTAINTIMFGSEFKKLGQFKGKQNLSESEMTQVEKILADAGLSVKLERPEANPSSLTYETAEGKTIYVYAEEGEDPVGKRCVWADDQGEPTEEAVPQGEHELNDGSIMSVTINEGDGFSYVDEISEAQGEDEQPSEEKKKDEKPAEQVRKETKKAVAAVKGLSQKDRDALAKQISEQIINSSSFGKAPDAETNGDQQKLPAFKEGAFEKRKKEIQSNYYNKGK